MFLILVTSFSEIGWVLAWLFIAWNEFYFLFFRVWVWHLNYYNPLHYFNFLIFSNCIRLIFIFIPLSIYLFIYSLIHLFFNSMNWHFGFLWLCDLIFYLILFYFQLHDFLFQLYFYFAWDLEPSRKGDHDQIGKLWRNPGCI